MRNIEQKDGTPAPSWHAWAKFAGGNDFIGGGLWNAAIHYRIGGVFGDPQLPYQVVAVLPLGGPEGESRITLPMYDLADRFERSAQLRLLRRPLGMLFSTVISAERCEVVLRGSDASGTGKSLQGLASRFPSMTVEVIKDAQWTEALRYASKWNAETNLQDAIRFCRDGTWKPSKEAEHPALRDGDRTFRAWVKKHPPRCLSGLRATWVGHARKLVNQVAAAFDLADASGAEKCRVHVHASSRNGAANEGTRIGPVHLAWATGDASAATGPALFFDTNIHGYHGELGHGAHIRGEGVGAPARCPRCGSEWFRVRALFDYHQMSDLADESPDFPVQDYFVGLILRGTCSSCRSASVLFGLGEL